MMTKINTKREYKPSSIDWLGELPNGWVNRRMKFLFSLQKRPVRDEDEIITAFRDGVVTLRRNRREEGFTIALQESGYQGIRRGNLVIHGMDGAAGAIGVSDSDGKATPVYSVCGPKNEEVASRYYAYLLRTLALTGYVASLARGIRERSTEFKWNIIGNLNLILPPHKTQKQIADFLDRETAKIDEVVAKKQKLIALLKEKRQRLITQAVTKGLDPKAKMKPSSIDWLGDIPAEWESKPLKFLFSYQAGGTWGDEERQDDHDIICIRVADFDFLRLITFSDEYTLRNLPQIKQHFLLDERSIMLEKSGGGDQTPVGRAVRYTGKEKATCSNFIQKLQVDDGFDPEFVVYLLSTLYFGGVTKKAIKQTTGIQNLDLGYFFRTPVYYPQIEEQKEIASHIREGLNNIFEVIKKIEPQIEKLKEYRSSLIYSAVTGKIKV